MPSPQMRSGQRSRQMRLSEVARHVVLPEGIESTGWPAVRDKCRVLGINFDRWQDGAGRAMMGKRADGKYAASVGGVVLSIPRQVGKTFLIGAVVFALCLLFPGLKVIWTAHHTTTADETFESMQEMAGRPKIRPYVSRILKPGFGRQLIIFKNGSRIEFGAREHGFGRGKTKVGILVLDEAQILTEKAMENLVPTLNQAENPLMFLMGTPPRPIDPGEVFSNRRKMALAGESKDTLYVELSADRGAKLDDRAQWRKANPSVPLRTPESAVLRMLEALGEDSFRREAYGIWDEESLSKSLISADEWGMLLVPDGEVTPVRRVVGVKFSVDGALAGLSLGVRPDEGPVHVSGIRLASMAEGVGWIVDWCEKRRDVIDQIVVDGKGGSSVLVDALVDAGFSPRAKVKRRSSRFIRLLDVGELIGAHAEFLAAVRAEDLSHGESPTLDGQVAGSMRRNIGTQGGWGWQAIRDTDNTTLLDSATLAWWGAKTCTRGQSRGARML